MEQRVIRILPYSYSSLHSFETCPKKHYGERLTKEFARPYNKAADDGDSIHKQAENYALKGEDFDNPYKEQIIKVIDELRGKGEFFAEKELSIRKDLTPCGWWDKDCYCRNKIDLLQIGTDEATVIDWKTGKPDPFSTQLKLNALLVFSIFPNVQKVHTRYEWLKPGYATKAVIHRTFFGQDWGNFEKRVEKYKQAFESNTWPERKSGLCKNYCGVTTCVHNGK